MVVKEHDIKPEDIEAIDIGINSHAYRHCIPEEVKLNPKTIVDAQFSIQYPVVAAIIDREVVLGQFSEKAIRRPEILELLQRVHCGVDPEIEKISALKAASFARVKIRTKDGNEYEKAVTFPKGHSQNPMTDEELADKFRDCAANAAKPIPEQNVEKALDLLLRLEEIDDIRKIVALISPQ